MEAGGTGLPLPGPGEDTPRCLSQRECELSPGWAGRLTQRVCSEMNFSLAKYGLGCAQSCHSRA